MTYKGIELKEFESEKPVIFDPPKRMLVWDYNDETPTEVEVIAFIPNRYHKAIEQMSVYIHCAEIPEVMCRRAQKARGRAESCTGDGQDGIELKTLTARHSAHPLFLTRTDNQNKKEKGNDIQRNRTQGI